MSFLQAILLGIIQGLTEFLPISSSAHLVLVPYILGWHISPKEAFAFNVLVQNGTLLAVIVYFWKDLAQIFTGFLRAVLSGRPFRDPSARMGWLLILATIPAGLFGLTASSLVKAAFNSALTTALFLLFTAGLLLISENLGARQRTMEKIRWKDALIIGIFQALSVFPGVSRSGSTIAGGVALNFDRSTAARFSFLMSIPIMLAAGIYEGIELVQIPVLTDFLPVVMVGFITSAVIGYISIRWLLTYLMHNSLKAFAIYCLTISLFTLSFAAIQG